MADNTPNRSDYLEFRREVAGTRLPVPSFQAIIFGVVVATSANSITARRKDTGEIVEVVTAQYRSLSDILEGDDLGLEFVDNVWQATPVMAQVVENSDGSRDFYASCASGQRLIAHAS